MNIREDILRAMLLRIFKRKIISNIEQMGGEIELFLETPYLINH